jgi:hypothetical protein
MLSDNHELPNTTQTAAESGTIPESLPFWHRPSISRIEIVKTLNDMCAGNDNTDGFRS